MVASVVGAAARSNVTLLRPASAARRQRAHELGGGREAIGRLLGQRPIDDADERVTQSGTVLGNRWGGRLCVLPHHDRRRTREGRFTREHLVEDTTERVEIGAAIERRIGEDLLRRHVLRRADDRSHRRQRRDARRRLGVRVRRRRGRTSDAKVRDQRNAFEQQDVRRLHVAVHEAACMRVTEPAGDAERDPNRFGDW